MKIISCRGDLYREFGRVVDVCEGTGIDPLKCVKWINTTLFDWGMTTKAFDNWDPKLCPSEKFTFAFKILDRKPVFEDSVLYSPYSKYIVQDSGMAIDHKTGNRWSSSGDFNGLSWNPPKLTFKLNGAELPVPDAQDQRGGFALVISTEYHDLSGCICNNVVRTRVKWKCNNDRDGVVAELMKIFK